MRTLRAGSIVLTLCSVFTASSEASGASASKRLHALFDETWEHWMREYPTWASQLGDRRYNRRWAEVGERAERRRDALNRRVLSELESIDATALSGSDRLNRDLFEQRLEREIAEHRFRHFLIPLNQRGGVQTAHETAESLRFARAADYRDWIARLEAVGESVDQTIAVMRKGIAEKIVHPKVIMQRLPNQIAHQLVDEPTASPFYKRFLAIPEGIEGRDTIQSAARRAVEKHVIPAYQRFDRFFRAEYLVACRETHGVWDTPLGDEYYAFQVKRYTTTELSPDEVHEIGLAEVARIRTEMLTIIEAVGFAGTFDDFLQHLRTDPKFYHETPAALLEAYRAVSKRADPELVHLFGKLPRMPYGVKPIPDELAPDTTTAYYSRPAADGTRAGNYYVNLYRPETRPIYEIEALTLHEAVPGHHLQIALSQELGELPKFRRYTGYTAFTEGWGLYAESLGEEMGFYKDPYSKFGQLTYEMWRAVRLVVDTGIHKKRWKRQRAIDFFAANAAKSMHDIENEIDRYIAWPGQALAYKIGELRIKELRREATAKLGDQFDVRAFHDVVLGSGAVPLDVLERNVRAWVESFAAAEPGD